MNPKTLARLTDMCARSNTQAGCMVLQAWCSGALEFCEDQETMRELLFLCLHAGIKFGLVGSEELPALPEVSAQEAYA